MKKYISVLVAAMMMVSCLCACASKHVSTAEAASDVAEPSEKLQIVTTIFPEYDWVMNVLGDKAQDAEVTMLLDNGVDLHSYQPTAEDIMKIAKCDLFIYVGGESDEWVEDALKEATNKDMVVIDLLDELGDSVKEEEVVEGMEAEEEEHEHEHEEGEEEEEEVEYDEHVWLSLRSAATLTKSISKALQSLDQDNASVYDANAAAYVQKLEELDKKYQEAVKASAKDTVLFGDRFPFRYMTDDYGLSYYAAFVGCSAETEASFETISFLSGKVDELGLGTVLTIEGPDHRIAETIVQNTQSKDQKILTMDSMQSTTAKDVQGGTTYLGIMEANLGTLTEALN
ncbi:zinc ABC transporter substrate-binding protein [Butyrivibrio sp. CB08]|uniref:metal ABC transporter substrate-binding protein n=1 Tax=Butyrivibrio sp. CB08 TaxID=2364879 RepID=UPI000EA8D74C|nr:metal ABC transporter substrate-binding protein [Butyrivibrio sp. CB08]RKM59205.1 zinc ABC transporter substrate-binding protein [Butyrivibrio sp. CB08]